MSPRRQAYFFRSRVLSLPRSIFHRTSPLQQLKPSRMWRRRSSIHSAVAATTVVEAQRLGRNGVSADINSLATFITTAKTTLYSEASLQTVEGLAHSTHLRLRPADGSNNDWVEAGYWRNIDGPETWRIRSLLAEGLKVARGLDDENAEMLLRCALLRTGQWALGHAPVDSQGR